MKLLGLDPGKTTGWAIISLEDKQISLIDFGVEKDGQVEEITKLIQSVDMVIAEDFKLRPVKARAGVFDYSDMIAPKVIGKIELLCDVFKKPLVKQSASVKPVAYGFAGLEYVKGKKNQHWKDAYCHAVYYCVTKKNAFPVTKPLK